jgi:predicted ribosomally synthesized peptide with SipW-like signal peptide
MTRKRYELTRRKILASVGAVGVAGAGAGLGTSALFSDEESFTNNILTGATWNLVVDYVTTLDQGTAGTSSQRGEVDGDPSTYDYTVSDLKPGDSGTLVLCPKLVEEYAGYLWVGSPDGLIDYENGQTEPEGDVDASGGGNLGASTSGAGAGELSDAIQVTVSYAEGFDYDAATDSVTCTGTRELNNPDDYTLADLAADLRAGFQIDGQPFSGDPSGPQVYPGSPDRETQTGPCLCIEWTVPTSVGNEIQSDALEFPFEFRVVQAANNSNPVNPFVPTNGLVGYWPLNSVEDGTAEDRSGNGNDGTVQGDVSAVAGQVAGAGSFDGNGDYVEIPDDQSLGVTNVTVSAWVYRDGSKNRVYVVDGRDHNYGIKFDDGTSTPRFFIWVNNSVKTLNASSGDIPDQTWTHVAGTYDGSELNIYVNGANEGTRAVSGAIDVSSGPGRIGDYIGGGYEFRGRIDDVRIYDRALSELEIATLTNV